MNSISLITQITFSPHKNPEMSINISIYMFDTYGHLMAYVQSNSGQLNDSGHPTFGQLAVPPPRHRGLPKLGGLQSGSSSLFSCR